MNWQGFIGFCVIMLSINYLGRIVELNWQAYICLMLIGIGGVIYGDAK